MKNIFTIMREKKLAKQLIAEENRRIIEENTKRLQKVLGLEKLEKVVTESELVNTAIEIAESLNGYIGGSRRFNIGTRNSDVDIFFTKEDDYNHFLFYLSKIGTMDTFNNLYRTKPRYAGVKSKNNTQLKYRYIVDNMQIDISCVDSLLTLEQEVLMYAKRAKKTDDITSNNTLSTKEGEKKSAHLPTGNDIAKLFG